MENEETFFTIEGGPMAKGTKVTVQKLALNKIKLSRNSRLTVSKDEMDGLMSSIKEEGLLQPIGVIKNGTGYEICYGNRRFLACSKLGFSHIPVVVHEKKKDSDADIKNLTENLQRRNITLAEAGRYMEILKNQGLSLKEISVRIGVTPGYVDSCLKAFREVPKEFRDDLEISVGNKKRTPGKIPLKTARAIINADKSYRLTQEQTKQLFSAAKRRDDFKAENVMKYAASLQRGESDFMSAVGNNQFIRVQFLISETEMDRLRKKHIDNGPFRSVTALACAVLKGQVAEKFKIV